MAWKDKLQIASYKGIVADIQSVSDKGTRSTAGHKYPYRDGTDVEDLGMAGDQISTRWIFFGDDYELRLNTFLQALRSPGAGVLMHPVFGEIKTALPISWSVDHNDEAVDQATVAVEFVNAQALDKPFTAPSPLVLADQAVASADAARTAADNGLTGYINKLRSGPLGRVLALKDKLSQSLANAKRLLDITPLKVLLSDFDYVLYPSAFMADLRSTFDVALQGLPFGGRNNSYAVAGAVLASSGAFEFYQVLARVQPSALAINIANDTLALAQSLPDQAAVRAHCQVHGAAVLTEAAMLVLAGEADTPLLARAELEQLANQTRTVCQAAIDAVHAAYTPEQSQPMADSLRKAAFYVQEAATGLLNQRPAIGRRLAPVAGPLRLVAQALYADPTRTLELARLNRLGRQPFVDYGQELTAYAK